MKETGTIAGGYRRMRLISIGGIPVSTLLPAIRVCELFKTGLEIRDTSLCGELAQASKSRLVNRPFSRGAMHARSTDSSWLLEVHEREQPLTKYQEEVFPTREELQEALRELNYPGGLNWAQLFIPIDDQYWDFFWYLAPKDYQTMSYASMQEQASMRRDFLARVLAMESESQVCVEGLCHAEQRAGRKADPSRAGSAGSG